MNNKLFYESPFAELIFVRFEENILSGEPTANPFEAEENATYDDRSGESWW